MKIKEKIYVVVDKEGIPHFVGQTREYARSVKRLLNKLDTFDGPYNIIQYKRWKKVS